MSREQLRSYQQKELTCYCNSLLERNIVTGLFASIENDVYPQFEEHNTLNPEITLDKLKLIALGALKIMFEHRLNLSDKKIPLEIAATDSVVGFSNEVNLGSKIIEGVEKGHAYMHILLSASKLGIHYFFEEGDILKAILDKEACLGDVGRIDLINQFARYIGDAYSRCVGNNVCVVGEIVPGISLLDSYINKKLADLKVPKKDFEDMIVKCGEKITSDEINKLNDRLNNQLTKERIVKMFGLGIVACAAVFINSMLSPTFVTDLISRVSQSYNQTI